MTADDVYRLVDERTLRTQTLLLIVALLIVIQIVAKLVIFRHVVGILRKAGTLIHLAEVQAKLTDAQTARTGAFLSQTKEVTDRVVKTVLTSGDSHKGDEGKLDKIDRNVETIKHKVAPETDGNP